MVTKRYFAALKQDKFTMPRIPLSRRLAMEARESDDDDAPPPSKRVAVCKATEASEDNARESAALPKPQEKSRYVRFLVYDETGISCMYHIPISSAILDHNPHIKEGSFFRYEHEESRLYTTEDIKLETIKKIEGTLSAEDIPWDFNIYILKQLIPLYSKRGNVESTYVFNPTEVTVADDGPELSYAHPFCTIFMGTPY